jgi:hypothetical protein
LSRQWLLQIPRGGRLESEAITITTIAIITTTGEPHIVEARENQEVMQHHPIRAVMRYLQAH